MAYDNPHGFSPIGNPADFETFRFNNGSGILYKHDVVRLESGVLVRVDDDESDPILGVVLKYAAASATDVEVCIDPRVHYGVQAETGFAVAQTDVGGAFGIGNPGAPSSGLKSNMELVTSGTGTQFILIGIQSGPQIGGGVLPTFAGTNVECVVKMNLGQAQIYL